MISQQVRQFCVEPAPAATIRNADMLMALHRWDRFGKYIRCLQSSFHRIDDLGIIRNTNGRPAFVKSSQDLGKGNGSGVPLFWSSS